MITFTQAISAHIPEGATHGYITSYSQEPRGPLELWVHFFEQLPSGNWVVFTTDFEGDPEWVCAEDFFVKDAFEGIILPRMFPLEVVA